MNDYFQYILNVICQNQKCHKKLYQNLSTFLSCLVIFWITFFFFMIRRDSNAISLSTISLWWPEGPNLLRFGGEGKSTANNWFHLLDTWIWINDSNLMFYASALEYWMGAYGTISLLAFCELPEMELKWVIMLNKIHGNIGKKEISLLLDDEQV